MVAGRFSQPVGLMSAAGIGADAYPTQAVGFPGVYQLACDFVDSAAALATPSKPFAKTGANLITGCRRPWSRLGGQRLKNRRVVTALCYANQDAVGSAAMGARMRQFALNHSVTRNVYVRERLRCDRPYPSANIGPMRGLDCVDGITRYARIVELSLYPNKTLAIEVRIIYLQ
jgi:hypothetical protein